MASCVTLKRSALDSPYGHKFDLSPKRRCLTGKRPLQVTPQKKKPNVDLQSLSESLSESQFRRLPPLEPSRILDEVTQSYKLLKRRRMVPRSPQQAAVSTTPPKCPSPASSSDSDDLAPTTSKVAKLAEPLKKEPRKYAPDTTIRLTISNVATMCETLLRQREDQIREEYDKILAEKLSEQYEVFCRYTQDQLRTHKSAASSSYIS